MSNAVKTAEGDLKMLLVKVTSVGVQILKILEAGDVVKVSIATAA